MPGPLADRQSAVRGSIGVGYTIDLILLVILLLIIIVAISAASSLTRFGLLNPSVTQSLQPANAQDANANGGDRFDQSSSNQICQDLYAAVNNKYGVKMDYFYQAADKWHVPVNILVAQAQQESAFNPNAKSGVGAAGIMQIMPGTWSGLYQKTDGLPNDASNAQASIFYGAKYDAQLYQQYHDWDLTLAAYNAGPGNVTNHIPNIKETQDYVKHISAQASNYQACLANQNNPQDSFYLTDVGRPDIGTDLGNFRNLDLSQKNLSIVLHNTVTQPGTGIPNNFKGADPADISHFVVDGKTKYQLLPIDKVSRATYGLNSSSLSIEMVYMDPKKKQGEVLDTTTGLVAELMAREKIPLSRIYAHSEVANGKTSDGRPIPTAETYPGERSDPGQANLDYIKNKLRARSDLKNLGLIDM